MKHSKKGVMPNEKVVSVMKMVKVKFSVWTKLIKKLKECMRANRALNKQNKAVNAHNNKDA